MNFLRLIADAMRGMLDFPYRFIQSIKTWRQQRLMLQLSARDVTREAEEARGAKGFFRRLGKIFLIIVAIVLLVLFFWFLYWLNDYWDLPRVLGGPWPWLRPFWLPILVVLFVATFYFAMRLWGLLGPERDANAFPDIDAAWAEAEAALVQAGIALREVPVYLVLGKPVGSVDAVFSSSRVTWLVRQMPLRVDAPFQVYAHRKGIFVALGEHSLLGKTLVQIATAAPEDVPQPTAALSSVFEEPEVPAAPNAPAAEPPKTLAAPNLLAAEVPAEPATRDVFASFEHSDRRPTLEELTLRDTAPRAKPLPPEVVELTRRRVNATIRVIARARRPFCAFNGVLVVVPNDALSNAPDAGAVAAAVEDDLFLFGKSGQTRCPAWLAVADIHRLDGFDALFAALDPERRQRLLGRDFPFQPDLGPAETAVMVKEGVSSLLGSLSQLAERLFILETAQISAPQAFLNNAKLFELFEHLQQRQTGIELLVRRIINQEAAAGVYFGGFYLTATGTDPNIDQAFMPGVFRLMLDNQSKVTWTADALAEEADFQRWAVFGYAAMAGFCVLLLVLGYWRWQGVG